MNIFMYLLYSIVVISTIYNVFPLYKIFGPFGGSLSAIITPILYVILLFISNKKNSKKDILLGNMRILILYLIAITLVFNFIYLIVFNGDVYFLGENLAWKSLKIIIYIINIYLFLSILNKLKNYTNSLENLLLPFHIGYLILFVLLLFEVYQPTLFNKIFHGGINYNRIRLLTFEASFTSPIIVSFFCFGYYYISLKKSLLNKIFYVLSGVIFLYTTGSKGLLLSLVLNTIVMLLYNRNIRFTFLTILGLVIFYKLELHNKLFNSIINDVNNYTSLATRIFLNYNSVLLCLKNPFGYGTGLFLKEYYDSLVDNMQIFYKYNITLNTTEILHYLYSMSDKNLTAKSGFFQGLMYWGIPGTYILVRTFLYIFKQIKKEKYLTFFYTLLLLQLFSFINFEFTYVFWLSLTTFYNINNYKQLNRVTPIEKPNKKSPYLDKILENQKKITTDCPTKS